MRKSSVLTAESTLTSRYQTTIPNEVRQVLGLQKNDKIRYLVQPDGSVLIRRVETGDDDQVMTAFLDFLEQDMIRNPGQIQPVPEDLLHRAEMLLDGMEIDLNAALDEQDD
jgi:antitoxin PrlF